MSNEDDMQADRERALRQREYLAQLEEDSEEPTSLATTTEGEHTVQVQAVLQMFIPDPGFDFFPFRIPDPNCLYPGSRIRIKEIKYFNPKKWFLSSRKYDPGCSSRIRMLTFYPFRIPDPGVKKSPDPGSGSATLGTRTKLGSAQRLYSLSAVSLVLICILIV